MHGVVAFAGEQRPQLKIGERLREPLGRNAADTALESGGDIPAPCQLLDGGAYRGSAPARFEKSQPDRVARGVNRVIGCQTRVHRMQSRIDRIVFRRLILAQRAHRRPDSKCLAPRGRKLTRKRLGYAVRVLVRRGTVQIGTRCFDVDDDGRVGAHRGARRVPVRRVAEIGDEHLDLDGGESRGLVQRKARGDDTRGDRMQSPVTLFDRQRAELDRGRARDP